MFFCYFIAVLLACFRKVIVVVFLISKAFFTGPGNKLGEPIPLSKVSLLFLALHQAVLFLLTIAILLIG